MSSIFSDIGNFIIQSGFKGFLVVIILVLGFFLYRQINAVLKGDLINRVTFEKVGTDAKAEIDRNTAAYKEIAVVKDQQISGLTGLLEDVKASRDKLEDSLNTMAEENLELSKHLIKDIENVTKSVRSTTESR